MAKDIRIIPDLAAEYEAMKKKNAELEAELEAEKARKADGFGIEISKITGCVVIRLGSGYPISVYGDKLDMLIANFDKVQAFVETNKKRIKRYKTEGS
jgi:hypothetical protein